MLITVIIWGITKAVIAEIFWGFYMMFYLKVDTEVSAMRVNSRNSCNCCIYYSIDVNKSIYTII